jgi:hypothetical protein
MLSCQVQFNFFIITNLDLILQGFICILEIINFILSVVLRGVGEDVRVVLQLVLDVPFHQDFLIVSAAIVFTEELLGLPSHEVGGGPLHPTHEHGDPQEEDHLDLPGSKLSNSFENIFVENFTFPIKR